MTPFKIRERLKNLLGLAPATPKEPPTPRRKREPVTLILVDAEGNEQEHVGEAGYSPLYISGNMQKPIASGCNDSTCATCRIEVLEGAENLSPQDERERATLAEAGHSPELRLACRTEVLKGTVKVRAHEFLVL